MLKRKKLRCTTMFAIAVVGLVLSPPRAAAQDAKPAPDPLLDTLNSDFRAEYQKALATTLSQPGPMILEESDNLILVRNGERTTVNVKPVEYHELKAVAHIPLALYIMLSVSSAGIL